MPFCGVFQFAIPAFKSVFGRIDQGQQPFRGVGRLLLSNIGVREPQLGKCSDSRPFLYLYKFDENLCRAGADSIGVSMEIFMARVIFACLLLFAYPAFAAYVAVLETIAAKNVVTFEEKQYLTDVLRSEAVKALPAEQNFTIMTRENIIAMLPPGKSIEECEGECLVETGKNIAADYVSQAHVGRFANNLTITVELYETAGNKLLGSFSSRAPNVESLESEIREKSRELFAQIMAITFGTLSLQPVLTDNVGTDADLIVKIDGETQRDGRKFTRGDWMLTPGTHEIELVHHCYDPLKFKVNVLSGKTIEVNGAMNVAMGDISLSALFNENFREVPVYVNGIKVGITPYSERIPLCANVELGEEGFRERVPLKWEGKDKLNVIHVLRKAKLTEAELRADSLAKAKQIAAEDAARAVTAKEKRSAITKPISIAMMALGVVGVAIGAYENSVGVDERKKYDKADFEDERDFQKQWDKVESARTKRNVFFGVGFGLIGAGSVLFFVF